MDKKIKQLANDLSDAYDNLNKGMEDIGLYIGYGFDHLHIGVPFEDMRERIIESTKIEYERAYENYQREQLQKIEEIKKEMRELL